MLSSFKEGILLRNELVWKREDLPYYLCFAYGDWNPVSAKKEDIYKTESSEIRIRLEPEDIRVSWDDNTGRDVVEIKKTFAPQEEIKTNIIFLKCGGFERAKYKIRWGDFFSAELVEPDSHFFTVNDLVEIEGHIYKIKNLDGNFFKFYPVNNAPLPKTSGYGFFRDATGTLLVASMLDRPYILFKDEEIAINLIGYTN